MRHSGITYKVVVEHTHTLQLCSTATMRKPSFHVYYNQAAPNKPIAQPTSSTANRYTQAENS